jgi:hypothetical protein
MLRKLEGGNRMSLQSTKHHLIQLLNDQDNKVIALSGKWGTGKSYLWREVKDASGDDKVKGSIYVSLFGLSSIDQMKKKLIEMVIPGVESNPGMWESAKQAVSSGVKVLEGFHKGFGALNDLSLILAPAMLRNKVIVLDDIERKHDKLNVQEVMGFIDEFTQQHGVRIVLILNSDQLTDKEMWDTLREKVIDQEVRLETTPAEAFGIAVGIVATPYADRIKKTTETCGVTNIRIICKVIKAVNRILGKREGLSDEVLARVVPSTVFLAATHYKGLENGPDFGFILKIANPDDWGDYGKKAEELDEAGKQRAKWRLMLQEIGVNGCDEYENIVVDFLKSGLFDTSDVEKIIDRYASEADVMHAMTLAKKFQEHVVWHHTMTNAELVAEAQEVAKHSHLLDAYSVTAQHQLVAELAGGQPVADTLLKNWIDAFEAKNLENFEFDNFWNQPIHPDIKAAFDAAKARSQANSTVFDACKHIAMNSGWGHKQEAILKASTAQDFESIIRTLETDDLRLFMCKFLEMCVHPENYKQHFGSATDSFMDACRNIYNDPIVPRLGKLIEILFKSSKLESHLAPPVAVPGAQIAVVGSKII